MKKKIKKEVKIQKVDKIENVFENFTEEITCHWKIMRSPLQLNLISVSYFKRRGGAKKANLYFNGLVKLFYLMRKELKSGFKMRVYHDISTRKELYTFYEKLGKEDKKYLELFQYDIPKLYNEDDGQYHRATIGTLFRFLPFFNLPLHQNTDRIKISMDIDDHDMNILFMKIFKDVIKKDIYFLYYSHLSYYFKNHLNCLKLINNKKINIDKIKMNELSNDSFYYFGIASCVYQKNELNNQLFYDFCKRFIHPISNRNKEYLLKICYDSKNTKEYLQYGIDEIFLNHYMIPEQYKICDNLYKNNNKKISIIYTNNNDLGTIVTYLNFILKLLNILQRKEIPKEYELLMNIFLTEFFGISVSLKTWEKKGLYSPLKMEWKFNKLEDFLKNINDKESHIVYNKMKDMLKNKEKMKKVKLLLKQSFSESGMYSFLVPNLKKLYSLIDSLNYTDKHMMLTYKNHTYEKEFIKY